jgi:hypothetical protein
MSTTNLKIEADPVEAEPRKLPKGSVWEDIQRMDPRKELTYHVSTTAERKCERTLPSGRALRIFRDGTAAQYTCRATGERDTHEFRLEARDALALAKDPNIVIEFRRERFEITEKDLATPAKGE